MKIKILVTNGDPHIRESLHKVLQAEGHDVVTADTGQEGVRIFYADHFDLLLLDVDLPDTSGWNIFKTLTSINPFLPVVITGRNDHDELVVFEGGALLAKLLDVPKIMQAMLGDARRIVGDASLMTNRPARRRGPYAASPVAMLRVT